MKINDFILNSPVLTVEQAQTINKLEEALNTIMTNPGGHFYDFVDIKNYKELLSLQNKKFKKAFPYSGGIYTYQIQMYLENKYRHPVEAICSFDFSKEVFKSAFIRELAIHTYTDYGSLGNRRGMGGNQTMAARKLPRNTGSIG